MATKLYKGATNRGRLLGLQRANGTWLAVIQAFSTDRGSQPILTSIRPINELRGSVRLKADRWIKELA